ncbi:MAG: DNA methyltransferase [Candidatus Sumerlaeota bacterium]|nr:DNA methyltransferase [Candidatus Sumerlaeota bacterium]
MIYSAIQPILKAIPAARQQNARHYGVHPYFTRRPPNVVRAYVERYSRDGDVVLDPFGGTGVTAIEAFLLGRSAIHNDINPFANFIARNIADTTLPSILPLSEAFARVEQACANLLQKFELDESLARKWLGQVALPENIKLPRNSDAEFFFDMFTPRQLAGLAVLKQAIEREPGGAIRESLLLAWSASVAKLNKTFLSAKGRAESRGGSSIFSIYRYKLASKCVELPIWETFRGRFLNVLDAKEEVLRCRRCREQLAPNSTPLDSGRNFRVLSHDAADLDRVLEPASVDYIFTDPPYGAFISYLDLSIVWNHWLGFPVSDEAREHETIVGGERDLSEEHYKQSLARSIRTCFRLLRPDRWISIVFQHWDLSYFATILETASECGAELRAAITQTGDVIWSMHKKKNSASVLAGEMIITFYKPAKPVKEEVRPKYCAEDSPEAVLSKVFDVCLKNGARSFTSEALFNQLVIELWRRRALGCLLLDRREFASRLEQRGWTYNPDTHLWSHNAGGGDSLF